MGDNWDKEKDEQEDKTVSLFGEAEGKTVVKETALIPEEVKEAGKTAKKKSGGRGLSAIIAAAVVVVGIAGITAWQMKEKAAAEAAQAEETARMEAEEAEKKRLEEERAKAEKAAVEAAEKLEAEAAAKSEEAEEEEKQRYEGNEKRARELYDLLCNSDEEEDFSGGPIEDIYKLFRCYNSGEDIKELSLTEENDVIDYILKLQDGVSLEETYLIKDTEEGEETLIYINTEKSIYCVSEDTGFGEVKDVTLYYDVKVDNLTGLTDYWIYDGLMAQGKADDAGTFVHIYDEILSAEKRITSETDAYVVDQSNQAFQFYDIYNNEGGRRMEEVRGRFDEHSIPEWEFGEY